MEAAGTMGRISVRTSLWAAGLYALALLLIYYQTTWSMVSIWSRSDTFAHGFLILPISLWLAWTRRDQLVDIRPEPAWWVALLVILPGLAWLVAWLVDVGIGKQLALVAMLVGGVWAIMGHRLAAVLAFPLFFLFFAVPMGEDLIAPMMEFTASSTVWLIRITGIPVYREGLHFALPSGSWSVVEACSGVRYIIASVTVGVLYAYLTYRSWTRRILFVLVSAIVPVFANTLRAYIIVMLGHLSDMTIATGADHLIYGWVFFGLVIFVMFWLGSFFREDQLDTASTPSSMAASRDGTCSSKQALYGTLIAALLVASLPQLMAYKIFGEPVSGKPLSLGLPASQSGWVRSTNSGWRWHAPSRVSGQQMGVYERGDEIVAVIVQFADGTLENADVVGSSSVFAQEDTGWTVVSRGKPRVQARDSEFAVDEAQIRGGQGEILAWSWYLIGGEATSNDYQAKIRQTLARLGLAESGDFRIVLATPAHSSPVQARARLENFVTDIVPALSEELRAAAAKPQ